MTDDVGKEFDELIGRMSDPSVAQQVEVAEIAEPATIVEFTVPVTVFEHPELTLFETITAYLASTPRRPVAGMSISYEIRSHNVPHLTATLFLAGWDELKPVTLTVDEQAFLAHICEMYGFDVDDGTVGRATGGWAWFLSGEDATSFDLTNQQTRELGPGD